MQGLKVEEWQQWQTLCCYLMQDFVWKKFGHSVRYKNYGSEGQSQYGIDLIPKDDSYPVVGQCKLTQRPFNWSMVLNELSKTDSYQSEIRDYVLFTTAQPHTTIQELLNKGNGVYSYKSLGRNPFNVYVIYWSEIDDIRFIPESVLKSIFPAAYKMAAPIANPTNISSKYIESVATMKRFLPTLITPEILEWLESWDFSVGYVPKKEFYILFNLDIEHSRTVTALNGNWPILEWLHTGDRVAIAKCLPAADRFFRYLSEFCIAINREIISYRMPDGTETLSLQGIDSRAWPRITGEWKSSADYLATCYREDILGEERH